MAKFNDPVVVRGARNLSLGSLLGTRVSRSTFDDIERDGHRMHFGGRFDELERDFEERFIKPIDTVELTLDRIVNRLINPDRWRSLLDVDDFRSIPPSMELMIVSYAPMRELLQEGRIDGFGYDPDTMDDEDLHGRLVSNYRCNNVLEAMDDEGRYTVHAKHKSTDPELSADDLHATWETRRTIDRLLAQTNRDLTNIDSLRG